MGYYGKEITASDKSDEMAWEILTFFGIKDEEGVYDYDNKLTKQMIEEKIDSFFEFLKERDIDVEDAQTVAYHLLKRGVVLSDDKIDFFIKCFKNDTWAEENLERRILMNLSIEDLEKYKLDKTPVDIEHSFNFQNYFIHKKLAEEKGDKISSVDEIVEELEKLIGIKIIYSITDRYSLGMLVSEEDFKKTEPDGMVFGIKFYKII